jgi:hypothetical protein
MVAGLTASVSAGMYGYSGADLTAIHVLPKVAFKAGVGSVTLAGYSMSLLVIPLK